jgi:hypothetical protein
VPSTTSSIDSGVLGDVVTIEEVAAPPPEQMTEKQMRQLRRQFVTITHGTVTTCGHKATFSKTMTPRNNCIHCWEAYLMTSVDLEFIHAVITQKGVKELVKVYGTKFTKMFHGFLASRMLPALEAEVKAELDAPVQIEGRVIGRQQGNEVQASGVAEQATG